MDVSISLILIFAIGALGVYGFMIGGWASDSKYALLGSMRTCAQLVSYEVALALSVLGVVLMAGSLSLTEIVDQQQDTVWYAAPQIVGLLVFFAAGTAETNRPPFDLPEADTELVAGYHTEYSGMRFGLFSMAEYMNMITLSALCVTLFFGGWVGPWPPLGPIWFVLKVLMLIFLFIWLRATLPRLRYDQLMSFGWKVLLPVATLNALVTRLWWWPCEPAADRFGPRLRRHAEADLQEADHPAVPRSTSGRSTRASAAGTGSGGTRTGSRNASAARSAQPPAPPTASASSPPRTPPTTVSPPASATRASTRSTSRAASSAATASSHARSTRSRSSRSTRSPSTRGTT